jgi:hypothetical protein
MLTIEDLVRRCPQCGKHHPSRVGCTEASAEAMSFWERMTADALNAASKPITKPFKHIISITVDDGSKR